MSDVTVGLLRLGCKRWCSFCVGSQNTCVGAPNCCVRMLTSRRTPCCKEVQSCLLGEDICILYKERDAWPALIFLALVVGDSPSQSCLARKREGWRWFPTEVLVAAKCWGCGSHKMIAIPFFSSFSSLHSSYGSCLFLNLDSWCSTPLNPLPEHTHICKFLFFFFN